MGGGTTKLSLIEDGVVSQTAAINIGARLIAFDENDVTTRIEDAGRTMMKEVGYEVGLGQKITDQMKEDFGAYMAKLLFDSDRGRTCGRRWQEQLMVTPPFVNYRGLKQVQHIVFSGGVSEHVYDRDPMAYGDIGPVLGKNTRAYLQRTPARRFSVNPLEGIRATVIGAGEYTIQASGNTSYVSNGERSARAWPQSYPGVRFAKVESVSQKRYRQALKKFDLSPFYVRLSPVVDCKWRAGLSIGSNGSQKESPRLFQGR